MNVFKESLIGLSLVVILAGCSTGTNAKSPTAENATPNKMESNNQANGQKTDQIPGSLTSSTEKTDRELLSTVDVKLLDGRVEVSQPQAGAGALNFNIRNETKLPLNVSIVQTTLAPGQLMVKAGKVDTAQSGVKTVAALHTNPIEGGKQETITKTLEPGDYQVVVTEVGKAAPIASAPLRLKAL